MVARSSRLGMGATIVTWTQQTLLEVGNARVWSVVLPGNWFKFEINPTRKISIELAQGDGQTILGPVQLLQFPSQILYLPFSPAALPASDRRLALKTTKTEIQLGWKISISIPDPDFPPSIENQILALLQAHDTDPIDGGVIE